jgi:hypothetical protein
VRKRHVNTGPAWLVLIVHVFGGWSEYPVYDLARDSNWYAFGFLLGAGSPILGAAGAGSRRRVVVIDRTADERRTAA